MAQEGASVTNALTASPARMALAARFLMSGTAMKDRPDFYFGSGAGRVDLRVRVAVPGAQAERSRYVLQ